VAPEPRRARRGAAGRGMSARAAGALALLLALGAAPAPARAAAPAPQLLARAEASFAELRGSAKLQRLRQSYDRVIARYRAGFDGYPRSREAEAALLRAGEVYRLLHRWTSREGDLNRALNYWQRLVTKYPGSPLADDAQLASGYLLLEQAKDGGQAYLAFAKVAEIAPGGDAAAEAGRMLGKLAAYAPPAPPPTPAPEDLAALACPAPGDAAAQAARARVLAVRNWSNPEYTRVVIDIDRGTNFYANLLEDATGERPVRLYVDVFSSVVDPRLCRPIAVNDGILRTVRIGQFTPESVRVVLDIDRLQTYRIFPMESPFRIVIDVTGGAAGSVPEPPVVVGATAPPANPVLGSGGITVPAAPAAAPATPPRIAPLPGDARPAAVSPPPRPDERLSLARQLGLGIRRIVVDAGHGAGDPGAIGVGGLREKDVTLDIALRVRDLLAADGYEVVLTRDRDVYLPLEERTAIANKVRGDLFLSIHCNASDRGELRGVETYYLNLASSRRAMATAARENSMAIANMSDLNALVRQIFASKMDESSRFAELAQRSLHRGIARRYRDAKDLGVKQAPFYVLIGAQMPSILAEVSFINNGTEGRRLADPGYRQLLAESLADGVRGYVQTVKAAVDGPRPN